MPEVQESQGFKTLCSNLTANLEIFCAKITKEYVFKITESFGDIKQRLIWRPLAIDHQLLNGFVVLGGIIVIGKNTLR